ncbi:ATP-binding protein [Alishewanella sp. SMS8]|uniref:ATP-binding protein n=1 Tax=Alishewanella sp. SMS8 TaxID=2994676 RepID=UPI00274062AD|nr:ATP-binding protein [Alishewanella sp. SMS8]MDP5458073.1 ATP-binding protein [Alishewanella sp. SMS8]
MDKLETVTLSNCEQEPIHIPGAIQPFAWLFIVDEDQIIQGVSDNFLQQMQLNTEQVLAQKFTDVACFQQVNLDTLKSLNQILHVNQQSYHFRSQALIDKPHWQAVEIEAVVATSGSSQDAQSQAQHIIAQLLPCKSSSDLFNTLLVMLRDYIGFDRCMVYQFDEQWNGSVVAEAKSPELDSFLGLHFPASDIPIQARVLYQKKLTRLIADVNYTPVPLLLVPTVDFAIDMTDIDARAISARHIQYLQNMGVQATLVISLIVNGKLWGLVACHHYSGAHYLNHETRLSCETIALMSALFIERIEAKVLFNKNRTLRRALTIGDIQKFIDNPKAHQHISSKILALTRADGGAWFDGTQLRGFGSSLTTEAFLALQATLQSNPDTVIFIDSLNALLPPEQRQTDVAGVCVIRLIAEDPCVEQAPCLLLCRKEAITQINWAGNPYEKTLADAQQQPHLSPRRSFSVWTEEMKDRCENWTWLDKSLIEELQVLLLEAHLLQIKLQRHHELKVIADGSDIGVWSLDIESGTLYWSDRMFEIYGVDAEHFDGQYQSWSACIVESDIENTRLAFERAIHQQQTFQHSFRINHPKKGIRTIRAHADMLLAENGLVRKVIGTNVDITEEIAKNKAIQLSLDVSTKQARLVSLGELAATIGHEINNPLAIILSSLELQQIAFEETPPAIADAMETNKRAMTAAERIMKIVSGLNSLSRNSPPENKQVQCDLPAVVQEVAEMMDQLLHKNGVVIQATITATEHCAAIDTTAIQQVLINLINNAKDAMAGYAEKLIRLTHWHDEHYAYVAVQDHGTGITDETKARLFTPFFTTKKRGEGTGLGLSIVRSLLVEVKGDILLETSLGQGTTFTVKIPLCGQ